MAPDFEAPDFVTNVGAIDVGAIDVGAIDVGAIDVGAPGVFFAATAATLVAVVASGIKRLCGAVESLDAPAR